jgi:hypothetical protein
VGILVAATSKNPFVDVNYNYGVVNMARMVDSIRKHYVITRQFAPDYRLVPPARAGKPTKKGQE